MNYAKIIYTIADAAVDIPVAPLQMLQEQQSPFVVFNIDGITPMASKVKYEPSDLVSVTLLTFHNNLDQCQQYANDLRKAFSCASGVERSWMIDSSHEYDDNTHSYYIMQIYEMRITYTPFEGVGIGSMIIENNFTIA